MNFFVNINIWRNNLFHSFFIDIAISPIFCVNEEWLFYDDQTWSILFEL